MWYAMDPSLFDHMLTNMKLPGASDTAASFEFENEDHTLGNALRYMIMKKYEIYDGGGSMESPKANIYKVRRLNFVVTRYHIRQRQR